MKTLKHPEYQIVGQNAWINKGEAFIGEISVDQFQDVGCKWVVPRHSEWKNIVDEIDNMIAIKTAYALSLGLDVMACIGKSIHAREIGMTKEVCFAQMQAYLNKMKDPKDWAKLVVVYELVWSISIGKVATFKQV